MCEANGVLTILERRSDGYIKGKVGHTGFYIPARGGERMRRQAIAHEGQIVNATTVRGMLVKLSSADEPYSVRPVQPKPAPQVIHRGEFAKVGTISNLGKFSITTWRCKSCGAEIQSIGKPRFCPKCRR